MSRSFQGFLLDYCKDLTEMNTTSLKKFAGKIEAYPRAAEPLLLLAITNGRIDYLMRHAGNGSLAASYRVFLAHYRASGKDLEAFLSDLPDNDRFKKVLLAWRAESEKLQRDRNTLANIVPAFSDLLARTGMSRAEACRRVGLDKGNFYAFLKGDVTRLSRDTAIKAYRTLQRIAAESA